MKRLMLLIVMLLTCVIFVSCKKQDSRTSVNIFEYIIDTEKGELLPKRVDYLMSVEEVLEAQQLTEDEVIENSGHKRIVRTIKIGDFPYEVKEQIKFQEDKVIWGVEYWLLVEKKNIESVYEDLYKQAKEYMPAPAEYYNNGNLKNILTGKSVHWEDKKGNGVTFSVTNIVEEEERSCIIISLKASEDIKRNTYL